MNIVVFGTGPFCVPTLHSLHNSRHTVVSVVTRPIEDAGKRRKTAANPVREYAEKIGLEIRDPNSCNRAEFVDTLTEMNADLFFVCDYGQILSRKCLASARLGGINLHGSLLPKYRGAAPVQWAIYNGETETGVTVIHMTPKLDAGPCLTRAVLPLVGNENAEQVEESLSQLGVRTVNQAIEMLENWDGASTIGSTQDPERATPAPRIRKSDGRIDFQRSARQIVNQIRAFTPWPTSYCEWNHGKQPIRLIVHQASIMQIETDAPPGVIVAADKKLLAVQTGENALAIEKIQPAGKKPMAIADFLRGNALQVGQTMN